MLDKSVISKLKQVNISKDVDKVKKRAYNAWTSATKEQKLEIEALADVKRVTIQRVYKTGAISTKIAAAMGQVLSIDPLYLIGAVDEQSDFSEDLLYSFLQTCGYSIHPPKANVKAKTGRRKRAGADPAEAAAAQAPDSGPKEAESVAPPPAEAAWACGAHMETLSDEDWITLFKSLLLREGAGPKNAERAEKVKRILLDIE